jgi:hypothetical protein
MAIYALDKAQNNAVAGGLCHDVDRLLLRIMQYKAWLDTVPDSDFITQGGYVQADLDILRSAISDMDQLRSVYQGLSAVATAKDFRTFAKLMYPYGSLV